MSKYKILGILDAKVGYDNGTNIVYEDVPFVNAFDNNTNVTNITFEGDNTTENVFSDAELSGTVGADKLSDTLLEKLYGKTMVTVGLPTGIAKRLYMGDNTEFATRVVELVVTAVAVEEPGGAEVRRNMILTIPKANISPWQPGSIGNRAKQVHSFQWTAKKTTTDIRGTALPSVPADGCTYFLDWTNPL